MTVYASQIAMALRMIKAKGEACLWASLTAPTPDPDQPWLMTPGTLIEYTGTPILFLPLSRQWAEFIRYIKGTDVVTGSVYGLMGAVAFTPKLTDVVTRNDGTKLNTLSIDALSPNGEIILYTIEFTK